MRAIIRIAARNVALDKKRTLITIGTVIVGLSAINIGKGIISAMQRESELNITEGRTGEIQIHAKGYFSAGELAKLDYSIDDYSRLRGDLRRIDGVRYVTGRIEFGGLLAKEDETVVAFCRAVDVADEISVCPRIRDNVIDGRFLTDNGRTDAVMASGLARGTETEPGDTVIIVANTRDGFQNAVELEVVGIIEEKMARANTRLIYMPMGIAQDLLYMGDAVTEVVIKTERNSGIDVVNERIGRMLGGGSLESNTWEDVSAFFVDVMRKQNVVVFSLCLIFYLVVISSITNTMMLTVLERKREIGTMMAIGIKTRDIMGLVVTESMIIGLLGSLVGILISAVVIMVLGRVGITRTIPESIAPITIYPFVNLRFMLLSLVLGVLSSIAASFYPARRVLQVDPVVALRSP